MTRDSLEHSSGLSSRSRRRPARGTGRRGEASEDRIQLVTVGRSLSILDVTTDPFLGHLMTEDACWRFGYEHWLTTRPSRWSGEQWDRWQEEGERLRDKRARVEQLARELGLPPVPPPPPPWHRRLLRRLSACFRAPRPGVQ